MLIGDQEDIDVTRMKANKDENCFKQKLVEWLKTKNLKLAPNFKSECNVIVDCMENMNNEIDTDVRLIVENQNVLGLNVSP